MAITQRAQRGNPDQPGILEVIWEVSSNLSDAVKLSRPGQDSQARSSTSTQTPQGTPHDLLLLSLNAASACVTRAIAAALLRIHKAFVSDRNAQRARESFLFVLDTYRHRLFRHFSASPFS